MKEHFAHLPRRQRRRLARGFALQPRREKSKRGYQEAMRQQAEWDVEMEKALNGLTK